MKILKNNIKKIKINIIIILIFSLDIFWICKILVYMLSRKIIFYSINLFTDCFET